jgi:hypothetical protein
MILEVTPYTPNALSNPDRDCDNVQFVTVPCLDRIELRL